MTKWGFQGKHAHIYFIFVWRYSAKLGRKFAVFTCSGGMKTWKPMVVFIETWGFWRCERPSAFNIAKTPSFNETTIGFKFSTPRTRETANIRPSFTETVIKKKKNERFPLKTLILAFFGLTLAMKRPKLLKNLKIPLKQFWNLRWFQQISRIGFEGFKKRRKFENFNGK